MFHMGIALLRLGERRAWTRRPAIPIENATAANRAVNIPEFVNMPVEGIAHIATLAVGHETAELRLSGVGAGAEGRNAEARPHLERAVALDPTQSDAQSALGMELVVEGKPAEGDWHTGARRSRPPRKLRPVCGNPVFKFSVPLSLVPRPCICATVPPWPLVNFFSRSFLSSPPPVCFPRNPLRLPRPWAGTVGTLTG